MKIWYHLYENKKGGIKVVFMIYVLLIVIGILVGIFLDRVIPTKKDKIENEYVKIFKEAIEKDLEQDKVKKKN